MKHCRAWIFVLLIVSLMGISFYGKTEASTNNASGANTSTITDAELSKYTTLSIGSKGDDVLKLKNRLYALGYFNTSKYNNSFTKSTAEFVKAFQEMNQLPVDGIASPEMQAVLFSDKAIPKKAKQSENEDSFEIRNGIKWGMHLDEIKALTDLESLGESSREKDYVRYENVPVLDMKFNMYLIIADDEILGTNYGLNAGLQGIMYINPGYSILDSKKMYDDFDKLAKSLTSKYGKPTTNVDKWENESAELLYSKEQAVGLGFFTRCRTWDNLGSFVIELYLNTDADYFEGISTPTISLGYYTKLYWDAVKNAKPNTNGL